MYILVICVHTYIYIYIYIHTPPLNHSKMTPSCIFFLRLLIVPVYCLCLFIFGGPGTLLMEGVY